MIFYKLIRIWKCHFIKFIFLLRIFFINQFSTGVPIIYLIYYIVINVNKLTYYAHKHAYIANI